ncbi:MAG: GNAT family N-acetyltransferase [Deltaproteobacteria bacterium]|nr:GNAT family N-acetyltransferase [Candidatus Tharpella sp.]
MGIYNLDKLFSASTVAVVGPCSSSRRSMEWQLYNNLVAAGGRSVFMVNGGVECSSQCPIPQEQHYCRLEDIPESPGLVVSLQPLAEIPALVDLCGRLGVSNLIITSGKRSPADDFYEVEILKKAKQHKLRILGFNSMGIIVPAQRLNTSLFDIPVADGGLALLSQSGAIITSILGTARERGLGFSHIISLGGLSDIDFGDMIGFLGWSSQVSCILLYIENIKDVKKFMSACRSVARIKPIVAIKVGKSELGREVIKRHTGCPAGEDRVYDTAFRRAGIIRVDTVAELLVAGDHLLKSTIPAGRRLGIVTNSGGLGVLAVDGLERKGVAVTELSPVLGKQVRAYIAPYSGSLDPICIAADANYQRYLEVLNLCLEAREFDTLIVIMVLNHWLDPIPVVAEIEGKAKSAGVNIVYVWLGNRCQYESEAARLSGQRIKICFTIEDAVLSCYYGLRYHEKLAKLSIIPQRYSRELDYCQESLKCARQQIKLYLNRQSMQLDSSQVKELLCFYGLPVDLTFAGVVDNVDYEINLGSRYDVEFGPYIYLGFGGLQAQVVAAEEVILPPLDRTLARKLIDRTSFAECCKIRPFELGKLEEVLMRVAQMVVDLPELERIDLRLLIITGSKFVVADAKITLNNRGLVSPRHLSTIPYPNQYEFIETLRDGTSVLIRPIKPEDAAAHYEMVAGFSPQTRYFRFFSLREEISQEQMARFTQIDYDRDVAIIAEIDRDGKKISIGVNRLLYYPHNEEYEFAVVVADAWHGSGAGRLLMEKLIYIAQDRGIREIYGLVLRSNTNMMCFIKNFGFKIVGCEDDVLRVRLNLQESEGHCNCGAEEGNPVPRIIF